MPAGSAAGNHRAPRNLPERQAGVRQAPAPAQNRAMPPRSRRRDQPPPKTGGGEAEVLRGFLDYLRESVVAKVEGAPEPQVRTAAVPSGTNLLGLLHHL